jgi:hypothetical protein
VCNAELLVLVRAIHTLHSIVAGENNSNVACSWRLLLLLLLRLQR